MDIYFNHSHVAVDSIKPPEMPGDIRISPCLLAQSTAAALAGGVNFGIQVHQVLGAQLLLLLQPVALGEDVGGCAVEVSVVRQLLGSRDLERTQRVDCVAMGALLAPILPLLAFRSMTRHP
jgi:hypothetical protein